MKQKDLGLIAVIAIISGALSLFISSSFLSAPGDRKTNVEVVEAIDSEFIQPPKEYFNDKAFNPTRLIRIAEDPNSKPFEQ